MSIKIKDAQLKKLEPYALENYINELVVHCDESYPQLGETMGKPKLKEVLKACVEQAQQRGLTQRGSVKFYIDIMIAFGAGFETDPQYPWIQKSWADNAHLSQIERSSALFWLTDAYFDQILGEQSQYFFESAEKIQSLNLDDLQIDHNDFVPAMHKILQHIYPQKYAASDKAAITALIQLGEQKAEENYDLIIPSSIAVIVIFMFLMGHEFDNDPFYDWAKIEKTRSYRTGNDLMAIDDSTTMIKKLISRGKTWLAGAVESEHHHLQKQINGQ